MEDGKQLPKREGRTRGVGQSPERKSKGNEGSGPPIGNPDSSIEVVGVFRGYRRPQWRGRDLRLAALNRLVTSSRSSQSIRWLGLPIGDPDPSIESSIDLGIGARQSAIPTPPPRSSVPTEDAGDLGERVKVTNWRP
ncbi:hypothetical protein CRG98_011109 [Punica granatum]|uniref:Uncharacterized protein n=1 Tax=Punica granatum TaxID=22663 RepID=A0A2I0KJY1_PUNGR|nr:hypothetical protein CRG98_011109 [Punica granatum]